MIKTSNKKQTAVERLMEQLYKKGFIKEVDGNEPINLMRQAKEIENQRMIQFADYCRDIAVRERAYGTNNAWGENWELYSHQKIITTEELLNMFDEETDLP